MKNKILSIIVPSYNIEKYIDSCVPGYIDERLFDKIDIFFIDDGATDNTKTKLDEYLKKYPTYFHFVHKENGGHGSVINYGVSKCVKTKYFKVVDGDDFVNPDELNKMVDYLYESDNDLIVSCFVHEYPNKTEKQPALLNEVEMFEERKTYDSSILEFLNVTIHSATFKTDIFIQNKIILPEKVFYEDNLYILYPMKYVKKIAFVNMFVYHYRLGNPNQSVSILNRNKHYLDSILVKKCALEFMDNVSDSSDQHFLNYAYRKIAEGLSCYVGTICYWNNNRTIRQKCLELYERDSQFPLLIKEMKKFRFLRFTFSTKFRLINLYKIIIRIRNK